jgi:dienelactone hydrolase
MHRAADAIPFYHHRALRCGPAALGLVLLLGAACARAEADYAREKRWAAEIVPAILVGDPVELEAAGRSFLAIYAAAPGAHAGVIVVHGLGVHPDWGLVNVLRSRLADEGYSTLAPQMPVLAADARAEHYPPLFPEASLRLAAAASFLRARGLRRIAVVSHSLGSRMTDYHLERVAPADIDAWVAIGLAGRYASVSGASVPVLDLYGQRDLPAVLEAAAERAGAVRRHQGGAQVMVPGADHFFAGQEAALVGHVKSFLDRHLK